MLKCLLFIVLSSSLCLAYGVQFSLGTSHILDDYSSDFKTGMTLGLGGYYEIAKGFSVNLDGSLVSHPGKYITGSSLDQYTLSAGPRLSFFPRRVMTPYLSTSMTVTKSKISADNVSSSSSSDMGFAFSGGMEVQVAYYLRMNLGLRYHTILEKEGNGHFGNLLVGFTYSLKRQ
jgi:opacity protein-like surface antigen